MYIYFISTLPPSMCHLCKQLEGRQEEAFEDSSTVAQGGWKDSAKVQELYGGPTITDMPLEIRRKIYANLLLEKNVLRFDAKGYVYPRFETSLFRLSKEISAESLRFFYTENAFICFETSMPLKVDKIHRTGFKFLPESRARSCRSLLMKFQLRLDLREYGNNSVELELEHKLFAIFPARQLPLFMTLVNHSNLHSWNLGYVPGAKFVFRPVGDFSKSQDHTFAMLVHSVKRLRGKLDSSATIPGVGPTQHMSVVIQGKRDLRRINEIKPAILSHNFTVVDLFADASAAMKKADSLVSIGNYMEAIRCYYIALRVLKLSSPVAHLLSRTQEVALKFYVLRANVQMSLLYSKLGKYRMARSTALGVWQLLPTGNWLEEERAEVITRLTTALVDEISVAIMKKYAQCPGGNTSRAQSLASASMRS